MSEANTNPGVATDPDPGRPQLIDVPSPWMRWHWVVLVIAVLGLIPLTILISLLGPDIAFFAVFCIAVLLGLVSLVVILGRQVRGREHLREVLSEGGEVDFAELVRYGTKLHGSFGIIGFLEATVCALSRHGHAGVTIRNAVLPHQAPQIDPIPVNFEARPLDEADESLVAFEEAVDALRDEGLPLAPVPERAEAASPITRRTRRNIALGGGYFNIFMFAGLAALGLRTLWATGRVTGLLVIAAAALVMQLFVARGAQSFFRRAEWFVIPGGVLVRGTRKRAGGSSLHVYDRRKSVLIVHRLRGSVWMALVADDKCHHRSTMTQHEATLLLRAWLSPVPPPPVEQLTDLR
ncbi:MAG: hypothetical protein KJ749_07965 [Planctomycetes bacterium]|nr:hypothetical protein [Planctomycetota bacterium]